MTIKDQLVDNQVTISEYNVGVDKKKRQRTYVVGKS